MATIRKRGDRFIAQVGKIDPRTHEKIRVARSFRLKTDAAKWAQEIETDIERGRYKPPSADRKTTLSDLLDRYAREIAPGLKGKEQVLNRIAQWKARPLGRKSAYELKPADFHAHRRAREAEGRASSTIRNEMNLVSKVFIIAQQEWKGFEDLENPVEGVPRMRREGMPEGRKRRLSYPPPYNQKNEEKLLLEAAETPYREIIIIAIETAMRRGEICALQWSWIKPAYGGEIVFLPDTKNWTARAVPLSKRARDAIASLRGRKKTDVLFPELNPDKITGYFARLAERLGLEDLTFHDLRHEATSRLVASGMRLDEVRLITGHKSLELLARYTHPRVEDVMTYFS